MRHFILTLLVATLFVNCHEAKKKHRRDKLFSKLKKIGTDCEFTSENGNIGVDAKGKSGNVQFFRYNNGKKKKRSVTIQAMSLVEVDSMNKTVKTSPTIKESGVSVTWKCGVGNATIADSSGVTSQINILESNWTKTQADGSRLEFSAKLFESQYDVVVCQRKFNRVRIEPRNTTLGKNCSVVTTLPGLKWEFVIDNWKYQNPNNSLVLKMKIKTKTGLNKVRKEFRPANIRGKRRRAARKIVTFTDGYIDNPEEADVSCAGAAAVVKPVSVEAQIKGKKGDHVELTYRFPPTGNDCVLSYDPMTGDGQANTESTSGVVRSGAVRIGLLLVVVLVTLL